MLKESLRRFLGLDLILTELNGFRNDLTRVQAKLSNQETFEVELQITRDERDNYRKLLDQKYEVKETKARPRPVRPSYIPIAAQMRELEIKSRKEKQRILNEVQE